jgi:hypothetical protein
VEEAVWSACEGLLLVISHHRSEPLRPARGVRGVFRCGDLRQVTPEVTCAAEKKDVTLAPEIRV